jgi:hypothetical protein
MSARMPRVCNEEWQNCMRRDNYDVHREYRVTGLTSYDAPQRISRSLHVAMTFLSIRIRSGTCDEHRSVSPARVGVFARALTRKDVGREETGPSNRFPVWSHSVEIKDTFRYFDLWIYRLTKSPSMYLDYAIYACILDCPYSNYPASDFFLYLI